MSDEYASDMDYSDSDGCDAGYEDYYNVQPWGDTDHDVDREQNKRDPELAIHECLRVEEVERLLNENVETLSDTLHITPSLAKVLLHAHNWALQDIITKYRNNSTSLLVNSKIKAAAATSHLTNSTSEGPGAGHCLICVTQHSSDKFATLSCGHSFCRECWCMHFEVQITQGISTGKIIAAICF